ncbi:MAG: NCS2 family permease [Clostridia bacterium]|nr:NCS2 family permease [Clostridia bacterium]
MLERLFRLKDVQSDVRTEVIAGLSTFMAMAYILFVNPSILGIAGAPRDGVFFATAVGAGLATLAMGLFVNYPIALAPGMGLNAFYTFTVVLGMGVPWQTALGAVFISGIIFLILTVTRVRQMIVEAIPPQLKSAITVGIGLFITLVGLKLSGIMTINLSLTPETLKAVVSGNGTAGTTPLDTAIAMGDIFAPDALVAILGIILTGILMALRVRGAVLLGILGTMVIGIPFGVTTVPSGFSPVAIPHADQLIVGQLDILGALEMGLLTVIFTFTFVELFDSLGTIVGTAQRAGLIDKTGSFPRIGRALTVDAAAVTGGAILGTSTITAYIESATGVAAGGRTGLTAAVVGILFLLATFFAPVAGLIPDAATAPALVIVGVLMMAAVKGIDFDDFTVALPAFLTIILMPFTYSIANGVSAGLLLFPLLKLVTGRAKEVHWLLWILALVVLARFIWLLA